MGYKFIDNWLNNLDIEEIGEMRKNRKCAVICAEKEGGGVNGKIDIRLQEKGIKVDLWLTGDDISTIKYNDVFVIVIKFGIDDSLIFKLHSMGMRPGRDYLYLYHDITIRSCTEYYKDIWGNEISVIGGQKECNIRFKGWNSRIDIGMSTQLTEKSEINIGSNCILKIGNNVRFPANIKLRCEDDSVLVIGDNCVFGQSKIVSRNKLVIGSGCRSGDGLIIICEENTNINLGDDVLISSNVHMRSGNGHSIFDISQKENISERGKYISIGNHVWVGQDVTILFNSRLDDDCVVGAKSLVKNKHEKGSLLYGVPAKTVRNNIGWDMNNHLTYDEFMML